MSFDQLVKQVEQLSPDEKLRLEQLLHSFPTNVANTSTGLVAGWGRDIVIRISDDFDEPLDDFKEYME